MANTQQLITFHFDINLDQVSDELRNFRNTMETSIDSMISKLKNSPTLTKAFTAFKDEYLTELQYEENEILDIESLATMAYDTIERTKREVVTMTSALIAGIVSLTSVIVITLSSYAVDTSNKNAARLNDIELKQQRQEALVKELNAAFNLELHATEVNENDLNNKLMMLNEISNLRNKFRSFQHSKRKLATAIRKLVMGDVHPDLFPPNVLQTQMHRALDQVKGGIRSSPALQAPSIINIYKQKAQIKRFGATIQASMTLPVSIKDDDARILEYIPMPYDIPNQENKLWIRTDETLLFRFNDGSVSMENEAFMNSCTLDNDKYRCLKRTTRYLRPNDTCLGALYMHDMEAIMTLCETTWTPPRYFHRQLDEDTYAISVPAPETATKTCGNKTHRIQLHGSQILKIKPGCQFTTKGFDIRSMVRTTSDIDAYDSTKGFSWDINDIDLGQLPAKHPVMDSYFNSPTGRALTHAGSAINGFLIISLIALVMTSACVHQRRMRARALDNDNALN